MPVEPTDRLPFEMFPDKYVVTVDTVGTIRKAREMNMPVYKRQTVPSRKQVR